MPGFIHQQLRKYNVKGDLVIATTANVSLRNLKAASFDTKITLKGATAQLPNNGVRLDDASFTIECQRNGDSPMLAFVFSTALRAAGTTVTIEKGTASIDTDKKLFVLNQFDTLIDLGGGRRAGLPEKVQKVASALQPGGKLVVTFSAGGPFAKPSFDTLAYEFAAYARDIIIKPPDFPEYLTAVNGAVRARAGFVTFENVSAQYGGDTLHVASARMPVEFFNRFIHVKEINADVVLRDPHPEYPRVLENIFAMLNPRGPIAVAGNVTVDRTTDETKVDYNLQISSDHASLTTPKIAIPITEIKSDLTISPDKIILTRLDGTVFDGHVSASGQLAGKSPKTYQAQLALRGVELKEIIDTFSPEPQKHRRRSYWRLHPQRRAFRIERSAGRRSDYDDERPRRCRSHRREFSQIPAAERHRQRIQRHV